MLLIIKNRYYKKIIKPWGKEELLCSNDRYAGKLLYIKASHRLSEQYHIRKHETLYLLSGRVKVWHNNDSFIMQEKDILEIQPGEIHRFKAIVDSIFIEFSSPELDDVVRLSDDYNRAQ